MVLWSCLYADGRFSDIIKFTRDLKVRVFSPAEYPRNSLDASIETIDFRYKLGEEDILNTFILKHK